MKRLFILCCGWLLSGSVTAQVSQAEYFFDADPGFGQATPLPVPASGHDLNFTFSAAIDTLKQGAHLLYVRAYDAASGAWSLSNPQLFYKEAMAGAGTAPNLVRAEYFFDTDPGAGAGTPVAITPGQEITFSFAAGLSGLSAGMHLLYVRVQDANGTWSLRQPQFFFKSELPAVAAATITRAEYFIDTDPGFGLATPVPVTAGPDLTFSFTAAIAALPAGQHRLVCRVQDDRGVWSNSAVQLFVKEAVPFSMVPQLTAAEYYFDADPGIGAGHPILLTAGADLTFPVTAALASLPAGRHYLFVRVRDEQGRWSHAAAQVFHLEPVPMIAAGALSRLEYFFDEDPGAGHGTHVPFTSGQDISVTYHPSIAGLSTDNFHRLFLRARDTIGQWSLAASQLFFVPYMPPSLDADITRLEYFIDEDPGFGHATAIPFAAGLDVTISFDAAVDGLANGIHRLAVRAKDANGKWSLTGTQLFYREAVLSHGLPQVVQAEYFIDHDPGVGSATAIPVMPGQDITFAFSSGLAGLGGGLHRLYVRTKDADGRWSLSAPQLFYLEPVQAHTAPGIVKAEYFIDSDPGFGAAHNIPVATGTDLAFSFHSSLEGLPQGLHRLYVRVQDAGGDWSLSAAQAFYCEPVQSHTPAMMVRAEYFFDTDPGFGLANPLTVMPGQQLFLDMDIAMATLGTGMHRLIVRTQDAAGAWSHSAPQLFFKDTAQVAATGEYVRLEWFWDNDPGFGKAQQILLPAGSTELKQFQFQVPVPASFTDQKHYLYVRVGSDWSQTVVRELDFTGIPLPVTLLSFQAKSETARVRLDWSVAQEENMDRYVVERSTDGRKFADIGERQAIANGRQRADYFLYDEQPATGLNYYRLRQIEADGSHTYSAVATVLFSGMAPELSVYPNPASTHFQTRGGIRLSEVLLTDMSGKEVRRYAPAERYSLEGVLPGAYLVHLFGGDGQAAVRTIVVR